MAKHSAMQTVPKFMLESSMDIKKHVSAKLLDTLMKAVTNEALFGETIVSLGPIAEEEDQGTETISFRQDVNLTPLVRCRDCVHRYSDELGPPLCTGPMAYSDTPDDWFCAGGKRRKGGQVDV